MNIEDVSGLTPTDVYLALHKFPYPFILSGGVHSGSNRYSYVSASPFLRISVEGRQTKIYRSSSESSYEDPFQAISSVLKEFESKQSTLFPFQGGMVGYLSYDLKNFVEELPSKKADIAMPDCFLGAYNPVFIYDHKDKKGYIVSTSSFPDSNGLSEFKEIIISYRDRRPTAGNKLLGAGSLNKLNDNSKLISNMTRAEYVAAVRRAQEYISSGDIYQVNIAHRFSTEWIGDPFDLYLNLLIQNPMPFNAFMDLGSFQIICNSPERFLKIKGKTVETSPIKGTSPKGKTDEDDTRIIEELKINPKELAEHIMIVDLERSDLGRVCEPGTVTVRDLQSIDAFPNLHHMVSTITGQLKDELNSIDCLKASFPGGSITGTPKIRAIEIIDEIETVKRGLYTGAIGYIDLSGNLDLMMAIRTTLYKDNRLYFHVGSGIVADSCPDAEYDETVLKASAFLNILNTDTK